MSNPRSSQRTCARVATFHVDDEIEISSSLLQSDSLGDRASGAGPPALSLQGDADLAEAPGSVACNDDALPNPTLSVDRFGHSAVASRLLISKESWALETIGSALHHKGLEHEDDLAYKSSDRSKRL